VTILQIVGGALINNRTFLSRSRNESSQVASREAGPALERHPSQIDPQSYQVFRIER
jgi:hypothetical protein